MNAHRTKSGANVSEYTIMSKTNLTLAFLIMLLLSCDESFLTDCDKCYTDLDFSINLNIVFKNPDRVPVNPVVTIYEGNISDSIILSRVQIVDPFSYMYYPAILYKDYSATLEFAYDGQKYITTASACPRMRYDETTCDEPCYYVYNNVLDLRLRYD